jgi:hypothetical protein
MADGISTTFARSTFDACSKQHELSSVERDDAAHLVEGAINPGSGQQGISPEVIKRGAEEGTVENIARAVACTARGMDGAAQSLGNSDPGKAMRYDASTIMARGLQYLDEVRGYLTDKMRQQKERSNNRA